MMRRSEKEILDTVYRRSGQIRMRRHMLQILAGVVGSALVLTAAPTLFRQLAYQQINTADQPKMEEASRDQTGEGGVQTTERTPVGASPGARGSSKDTPPGGSLPAGTISQDPGIAGPPVYYTDRGDDAYGPANNENGALSQKEFDILRVDWAPVSGGYSTSITVAGAARDDGWYVSYGLFYPGETCQLYHFLTPGIRAFANAFCGWSEDGSRRFVGRVEGGRVTSTPTTSGGTLLVATFDNRAIPPLLQAAGRTLHNLSAFTCPGWSGSDTVDGFRCGFEKLDQAGSNLDYRL